MLGGCLLVLVVILIAARTGSIGKTFGFLVKNALYPILFGILGAVVGLFLGSISTCAAIGAIIGCIFVFKDASNKLK